MQYYECGFCGAQLSRFDGGRETTKCPRCGKRAKFVDWGPSGRPVDYHRPVGNKKPSRGWQKTSSRMARWPRSRGSW